MKILIDNGHGQTTPGKRSPDGRFLEFQFNRTIAKQIVDDLRDRGYDAELLVPEDDDVPLKDRCKRVNDIVAREGKQNVIQTGTKYIPASVVVGCEKSRAVWRLLILYWIQLY